MLKLYILFIFWLINVSTWTEINLTIEPRLFLMLRTNDQRRIRYSLDILIDTCTCHLAEILTRMWFHQGKTSEVVRICPWHYNAQFARDPGRRYPLTNHDNYTSRYLAYNIILTNNVASPAEWSHSVKTCILHFLRDLRIRMIPIWRQPSLRIKSNLWCVYSWCVNISFQ